MVKRIERSAEGAAERAPISLNLRRHSQRPWVSMRAELVLARQATEVRRKTGGAGLLASLSSEEAAMSELEHGPKVPVKSSQSWISC